MLVVAQPVLPGSYSLHQQQQREHSFQDRIRSEITAEGEFDFANSLSNEQANRLATVFHERKGQLTSINLECDNEVTPTMGMAILTSLIGSPLQFLRIKNLGMNNDVVTKLTEVFSKSPTLSCLTFDCSSEIKYEQDNETTKKFLESMQKVSALNTLDLSGRDLSGRDLSNQGQLIADLINQNKETITAVTLRNCNLTEQDIDMIGTALLSAPKISTVSFKGNNLTQAQQERFSNTLIKFSPPSTPM